MCLASNEVLAKELNDPSGAATSWRDDKYVPWTYTRVIHKNELCVRRSYDSTESTKQPHAFGPPPYFGTNAIDRPDPSVLTLPMVDRLATHRLLDKDLPLLLVNDPTEA